MKPHRPHRLMTPTYAVWASLVLLSVTGCSSSSPAVATGPTGTAAPAQAPEDPSGPRPARGESPTQNCLNPPPNRLALELDSGALVHLDRGLSPDSPNSLASWFVEPLRAEMKRLRTSKRSGLNSDIQNKLTWTYEVDGELVFPAESAHAEILEKLLGKLRKKLSAPCLKKLIPQNSKIDFSNLTINCLAKSPFAISIEPLAQAPAWYQAFTAQPSRHIPGTFVRFGLNSENPAVASCGDSDFSGGDSTAISLSFEVDLTDPWLNHDVRNWLVGEPFKVAKLALETGSYVDFRTRVGAAAVPVILGTELSSAQNADYLDWVLHEIDELPMIRAERAMFEATRGCVLDSAAFCPRRIRP